MGALLQTYLPLVIFIGIAFVISAALLISPFIIAVSKPDPEKDSTYECGFEAFGFWAMMVFLAILTIGFIYEWRKGALEWD
jgi:NADH-quinone oxidoreductase subunit A